ncbi:MAG: hypothetical protein ITG00_06220 [Flavobacterium sp.]|nr:hypothetical protein [Flavobacterium sp.]
MVTLDPFGYSESDTLAKPRRKFSAVGNSLHLKSKELTIWNLLLIREKKPFDSLLVKESERLIRSQRYIRRVKITPRMISRESDSVDVDIRVLDSWSLVPNFAGSTNRMTFMLTERNFMGFGHQVDNTYRRDNELKANAYSVKYTIPNVMNTYIRTTLNYDIDLVDNYAKSIDIERPFFSPFARWGGGVFIGKQFKRDSLPDITGDLNLQPFNFSTTDVWGGHAINIFDGLSEDERTTNLITTARVMNINYRDRPDDLHDPVHFFDDELLVLTGIGVASRQFVEDKYLFNYGIIEDVPTGTVVGITGGYQDKNSIRRPYIGFRASTGKYFRYGYISSNFEYGTFVRSGSSEQGAVSLQTNYFTKLIEIGSWKLRQFAKAQIIIGNNRVASEGDYLTLNEAEQGISGFNSRSLFGTKKWLTTFQTQSYSPWNAWGFRLNPFFNYTMGMVGNAENGFNNSRLYSQLGIGVIISNDYLVFSTFQLSFSFYPVIPEQGTGIFKTNALKTDDFGFQDFSLNKPRTVFYE